MVQVLNNQDLDMSGVVTIKDITKMENRIGSAIIVYALNDRVREELLNGGEEDEEEEGGDWEEGEEGGFESSFIDDSEANVSGSIGGVEYDPLEGVGGYRVDYYVACIRAPTRQTLQKFSRPLATCSCYLLHIWLIYQI